MDRPTTEQLIDIESEIIKAVEKRMYRTCTYRPGTKSYNRLRDEFLIGAFVMLDVLCDAQSTNQSTLTPRVWIAILRGENLTPKYDENPETKP